MIKRKYYYTAKCSGKCKLDFDFWLRGEENRIVYSKDKLIADLLYFGWKPKGKKWYCPECQK